MPWASSATRRLALACQYPTIAAPASTALRVISDQEKNLCIAVPAYGPNSGRGCIAGFGQWTWQKDPATGESGWHCQCANPVIYSGQNECSPVASSTLCTTTGLDSTQLMPAFQV